MQRIKKDSLEWLVFDHLAECKRLVHGVFLRHGGVSTKSFGSLNFSSYQGDSKVHVKENKDRALKALNLSQSISLNQIHGSEVVELKMPSYPIDCDGMVTDQPDIGIIIKHADCQAAIFYDPINHALANIHCGWRGNVQNIYEKTLQKMKQCYGSNPKEILVGISPSLGPQAAEFRNFATELPTSFWAFQYRPTYFDLWEISHWQLTRLGILPHHIEIAKMCTYSNPEDFFSFRRYPTSGRHATIAALKTQV